MKNFKLNRSLLMSGIETIMLGAYFVANSFRFARPDFFNTVASHIDDPPFATIAIILGTATVIVSFYNIRPLLSWCYITLTFVWMVYASAFLLQNIELWGHPFARLDCWLMYAVAARLIYEAWAGDTE